MTTGIMTMTTGVLLMKGDKPTPTAMRANNKRHSLPCAARPIQWPMCSMQPVRLSAALMTNKQAMVKGALLLSTDNTCGIFKMPKASRTHTAESAAKSGEVQPRTKATNKNTRVRPTSGA